MRHSHNFLAAQREGGRFLILFRRRGHSPGALSIETPSEATRRARGRRRAPLQPMKTSCNPAHEVGLSSLRQIDAPNRLPPAGLSEPTILSRLSSVELGRTRPSNCLMANFGERDDLNFNQRQACVQEAKLLGGGPGDID